MLELLRRGAKVAALDLSEDGLAGTAELADAGERLFTHSVNVTDRAAVEELPKMIADTLGDVDGLVNVAGIVHRFAPLHELSYDELERVINVNFWGTVITSKTFLPGLLQRPQASLVDVSSQGGLAAIPGQSGYGASKAAVKLLTECITGETRGTNLAVTIIFPGGINTNLLDNSGITTGTDPLKAENAAMKRTTASDAGRQIVVAVAKGTPRVRIGNDAKLLDRLTRLIPATSVGAIADKMKGLME